MASKKRGKAKPKVTTASIYAYQIDCLRDKKMMPVPADFLIYIRDLMFSTRWDNQLNKGSTARNILNFSLLNPKETGSEHDIFSGKFVQIMCRETLPLLDFDDGTETELPFPPRKGEKTIWPVMIAPEEKILVVEQHGLGFESKIANFFTHHLKEWNKQNPSQKIEQIYVSTIPKEDDPVGFLRKNPNIGSFEALLDAKEISGDQYGLMCGLLGGLSPEDQRLKIRIEITSTTKGEGLPIVVVSQLADFVNNIDDSNLYQASVKPMSGGRRASRATKLLDAIVKTEVEIEEGENIKQYLLEFLLDTIENLEDTMDED